MLRRTSALAIVPLALSVLAATDAAATAQRTFVASYGNDANPCSLTLPCRAFAAAIAQTADGGEVIVLDSAGYGPVTITQTASIIAPAGIYAGVSVVSGDGILVTGIGIVVTLRGLSITGTGFGVRNGINAAHLGQLRLEGLHVSGFNVGDSYGLLVSAAGSNVTVTHSVFEGNFIGIESEPPMSSTVNILVDDTVLTQNDAGYRSSGVGTTKAVITRSNASANTTGFVVMGSATDTLALEGCVISNNYVYGVESTGAVVLSNNAIANNGTGVYVYLGTIETRQNNTIRQNGTDIQGTLINVSGN